MEPAVDFVGSLVNKRVPLLRHASVASRASSSWQLFAFCTGCPGLDAYSFLFQVLAVLKNVGLGPPQPTGSRNTHARFF